MRAVVLAAAGMGRKEVERESVMADDGLASRQSLRLPRGNVQYKEVLHFLL